MISFRDNRYTVLPPKNKLTIASRTATAHQPDAFHAAIDPRTIPANIDAAKDVIERQGHTNRQ
jgi:hypothetical protein